MMNPEEQIQIANNHEVSLKGILQILKARKTFRKWPVAVSIVIALIISLYVGFSTKHSFLILQTLSEITMSVFPSLLGFSLGGYAIVVGFSNIDLIKNTAKKEGYSIYQKLSAIFAMSVVLQVFLTVITFFVSWVIKIDVVKIYNLNIPTIGCWVNITALFFILTLAIYSLLLMPYVVYNLFTLSQLNNLFFTKEKFKSNPNDVNRSSESSDQQTQ